jgi:hypothetical protein
MLIRFQYIRRMSVAVAVVFAMPASAQLAQYDRNTGKLLPPPRPPSSPNRLANSDISRVNPRFGAAQETPATPVVKPPQPGFAQSDGADSNALVPLDGMAIYSPNQALATTLPMPDWWPE